MWKELMTLARGRRHDMGEALVDREALVILRQQIREAAGVLERARLAVATAVAQEREDTSRADDLAARIEDLETRTVAALDAGRHDLAGEAAERIATLEADLDAARAAAGAASKEILRLRLTVEDAERRLGDLRRGQRLAEANGRVHRLRHAAPGKVGATLRDAEATLSRLRARQAEADATDAVLDEMDHAARPETLARRMAEAGCGAPPPHSAKAVLARLDERRRARAD